MAEKNLTTTAGAPAAGVVVHGKLVRPVPQVPAQGLVGQDLCRPRRRWV